MDELNSIVIVGGGTAGWLTASLLAGRLDTNKVSVCLVESPDVPTIGVGEGSTPQIVQCLRALGIKNSEWMPACKATRKMGIRFEGWGRRDFAHPFFLYGDRITYQQLGESNPNLLPLLAKAHCDDESFSLDETFLATAVAQDPLFQRYVDALPDRVSWGAFHFDAGLLGGFLGDWARAQGVLYKSANVLAAQRDEQGDVVSLTLDTGEELAGDLFFDCTGFRALLIDKVLEEPFLTYDRSLLCDRALVVKLPLDDGQLRPPPYTVSTTLDAGWVWQIPLADAMGCGYVFSGDCSSDNDAEREFRAVLRRKYGAVAGRASSRLIHFETGRRENAWVHNCVSVGLSSTFIEPLEATSIAMSLVSVARFLLAFERQGSGPEARDTYNRELADINDGVRDFIIMHYVSASREDTPFWRACREEALIPDSLAEILAAWREQGRLEIEESSFFADLSWFCMMTGGNDYPQSGVLASVGESASVVANLMESNRINLGKYQRWMKSELELR